MVKTKYMQKAKHAQATMDNNGPVEANMDVTECGDKDTHKTEVT